LGITANTTDAENEAARSECVVTVQPTTEVICRGSPEFYFLFGIEGAGMKNGSELMGSGSNTLGPFTRTTLGQ
jgi:hypothetical protein